MVLNLITGLKQVRYSYRSIYMDPMVITNQPKIYTKTREKGTPIYQ